MEMIDINYAVVATWDGQGAGADVMEEWKV